MIASITGRHVSVPVFQIGRLPWKSMPLIPGKEAVKKTVCALCFILPIATGIISFHHTTLR